MADKNKPKKSVAEAMEEIMKQPDNKEITYDELMKELQKTTNNDENDK